ncbi:methionine--tRNA ligase [Tropilaelaps mercedesae]|uniref:Methionine--tRNA ligase, cytoplasmic n=1 Tax=Tropilaelaps mercedesae TaxID=418985 RepID=A0A1V9XXZ8_9ACAR|nr:methionine--tRNA ligase [Tropilaelaps mercedesae]
MKLYIGEGSVQVCKLDAILHVTKSKVNRIQCTVKESPLKRLPTFELPDGDYLFSANAICRYLWHEAGNTVNSEDEHWLSYESLVLLPTVAGILQGKKASLRLQDFNTPPRQASLGYLVTCSTLSALSTNKNYTSILSSIPFYMKFATDFGSKIPKSIASESLQGLYIDHVQANSQADTIDEQNLKLTSEFIEKVTATWNEKIGGTPLLQKNTTILPEKGKRNILVTAALPYINNVPHLGNIVGSVLSADVFARFCRMRGYNTLYIGGTDEYGTATETKALEMECTPKELCDKFHDIHRDIYKWFNIEFDYFGRTSTPKQTEVAQTIFRKLHANGFLNEDSVEQLYCEKCPRFLADRFVEGICPICAYEDARGDQCDKCSKLINAVELKNPKCKLCKTTPVVRTSRHLFLDLPKIEPAYRKWQEQSVSTGQWTQSAKVITNSWLRDGLRPRCITRDLKWGIPVPVKGFEGKVFYVWFDAPIGYMSITASYTDHWEKWWKNPDEVELYQYMGKDNVLFHSLIFPMCLIGTGENFTKVSNVVATEYLNYEDTKFSKSRGIGVFGTDAKETGIAPDVWRFYMMYLRPESQDTAFSWIDLQTKNNSELLNNLGNFINRCLTFTGNNFIGKIPPFIGDLLKDDKIVIAQVSRFYHDFLHNLEHNHIRDALRSLLMISKVGNQYIQSTKPWELVKAADTKARCGSILYVGVQICALIAGCLEPFMPDTAKELRRQLNIPQLQLENQFRPLIPSGHKIKNSAPLFKKIESDAIEKFRKKFGGHQQQPIQSTTNPAELEAKVKKQGDKVRALKSSKANKETITREVNALLDLKIQLEAALKVATTAAVDPTASVSPIEPEAKIKEQGGKFRALKNSKADKVAVTIGRNCISAQETT